jgi:hypothetical protein
MRLDSNSIQVFSRVMPVRLAIDDNSVSPRPFSPLEADVQRRGPRRSGERKANRVFTDF